MKKWSQLLRRYFILIGLLANLAIFVGFGFLWLKLSSLGLSLPLFSEKVRDNLTINQPNLLSVVSPLLSAMQYLEVKSYYFRQLEPDKWTGVGAQKSIAIPNEKITSVFDVSELISALKTASAGQTILLAPGSYFIDKPSVNIGHSGMEGRPIRVVAEQLGTVKIFLRGEGFVINKPYWQFNNLHLLGNCKKHTSCEHAFHVVGRGQHVLIENNIIQDFNAMIKINGIGHHFPDYGEVMQNTIFNTSPRNTSNPVTPIDLMHANNWRVAENFIFDIQKSAGDKVSYAAFFKGGSQNGIFEKNLIICAANLPDIHTSIGLSLGGGGSLIDHRRDKNTAEHENGIIRNNLIMHCANDVGIYLNRAANSQIYNNTLYNTLGIDVRFQETTASIHNNVISGRIKKRDQGDFSQQDNLIVQRGFFTGSENLKEYFTSPDIGDFSWQQDFEFENSHFSSDFVGSDFCGNTAKLNYVGAYSGTNFCLDKVSLEPRAVRGSF